MPAVLCQCQSMGSAGFGGARGKRGSVSWPRCRAGDTPGMCEGLGGRRNLLGVQAQHHLLLSTPPYRAEQNRRKLLGMAVGDNPVVRGLHTGGSSSGS